MRVTAKYSRYEVSALVKADYLARFGDPPDGHELSVCPSDKNREENHAE